MCVVFRINDIVLIISDISMHTFMCSVTRLIPRMCHFEAISRNEVRAVQFQGGDTSMCAVTIDGEHEGIFSIIPLISFLHNLSSQIVCCIN